MDALARGASKSALKSSAKAALGNVSAAAKYIGKNLKSAGRAGFKKTAKLAKSTSKNTKELAMAGGKKLKKIGVLGAVGGVAGGAYLLKQAGVSTPLGDTLDKNANKL